MTKYIPKLPFKNSRIYSTEILDYANLILVAENLKPATLFSINPSKNISDWNKKLEHNNEVLSDMGLDYFTQNYSQEPKFIVPYSTFNVSKSITSLEKLMFINHTNPEERGKTLGYPQDAIDSFCGKNNSKKIYFCDIAIDIKKALNKKIKVPTWFAYLSHVPEKFDLINDNVSESSKNLGIKYQDFIRTKHPELAKEIETKRFKDILDYIRYTNFK